jgi:hypothetical protein
MAGGWMDDGWMMAGGWMMDGRRMENYDSRDGTW